MSRWVQLQNHHLRHVNISGRWSLYSLSLCKRPGSRIERYDTFPVRNGTSGKPPLPGVTRYPVYPPGNPPGGYPRLKPFFLRGKPGFRGGVKPPGFFTRNPPGVKPGVNGFLPPGLNGVLPRGFKPRFYPGGNRFTPVFTPR